MHVVHVSNFKNIAMNFGTVIVAQPVFCVPVMSLHDVYTSYIYYSYPGACISLHPLCLCVHRSYI